MARILFCAVALATLCVVLASDRYHAKAATNHKVANRKVGNLGAHDPYDFIQAEDFDFHVNTETYPSDDPDDNATHPLEVAFIYATSELAYYDVDFGQGANRIDMRVAALSSTLPSKAGLIHLHLNSTKDEPLVSFLIDYGRVYHYVTLSQYLDTLPSGLQNIFFTFEVDQLGYDLFNFNWFKFYSAYD